MMATGGSVDSDATAWTLRADALLERLRLPWDVVDAVHSTDTERIDRVMQGADDSVAVALEWAGCADVEVTAGLAVVCAACAEPYQLTPAARKSAGDVAARFADAAYEAYCFVRPVLHPPGRARATRAPASAAADSESLGDMIGGAYWKVFVLATQLRELWAALAAQAPFDGRDTIEIERWPALLNARSSELAYVATVGQSQRHPPLSVSASRFVNYSVTDVMQALDLHVAVVYCTGWTPGAHEHLCCLLLAYAQLLHVTPLAEDLSVDELRARYRHPRCTAVETIGGTPLAAGTAPPSTFLQAILPPLLRPNFLMLFERRFFHALRHSYAADAFYRRARVLHTAPAFQQAAAAAWVALVRAVSMSSLLRSTFMDAVRTSLTAHLLYPGDVDEAAYYDIDYEFGQPCEPEKVLYAMRRKETPEINSMRESDLATTVETWARTVATTLDAGGGAAAAAGTDADAAWEHYAANRPPHERAILLILTIAFDVYVRSRVDTRRASVFLLRERAYCDDASLAPPLDAPPASPDALAARFRYDGLPAFAAINQCYVVQYGGARRRVPRAQYHATEVSPHLMPMLLRWIQAAAASGQLNDAALFPAFRPLLAMLPPLADADDDELAADPWTTH